MWSAEIEDRIKKTLVAVDPRYEKEISGGYFFRAVPSFYNKIHLRETLVRLRYHDVPPDARILDVGCGVGQFLLYCWYHGYRNLEGRDQNQRWLTAAKALFDELAPECDVALVKPEREDIHVDMRDPRGGCYDVITMFGLISGHHIRVKEIFKPVYEALNPGGYYFVNDYSYNPHQLKVWMQNAGLQVVTRVTVRLIEHGATHYFITRKPADAPPGTTGAKVLAPGRDSTRRESEASTGPA